MATIIQIKRSSGTSAPSSLKLGELAYTYGTGTQGNLGDRLFIGEGGVDGNGDANNVTVIGGEYFTSQLDHAGGTLTAGYSNQTLTARHADLTTAGDSQVVGATYSMSLDADTTIAVGYTSRKDSDSQSDTKTELSVERALGGGASVYLDLVNLTGDTAANADGTAIGFGTSVSF